MSQNMISEKLNTKKSFYYVVCYDNSRHQFKYIFGVCLCSMLTALSNVSNLLKNGQFPISAYFGTHFCYHSNGKSQTNIKLIH